MPDAHPTTGLVLTGGGARAAYQVGVLKALLEIRRESAPAATNPFPVISGTSAGAINAAALACHADDFDAAVAGLCKVGPSRCSSSESAGMRRMDPDDARAAIVGASQAPVAQTVGLALEVDVRIDQDEAGYAPDCLSAGPLGGLQNPAPEFPPWISDARLMG